MKPSAQHPRASLGSSRPSQAARAFTLIELLTVIAIVGILAAIILPVMGKVRQSALKSDCAANLRRIGNATAIYAQDNKGQYPRAFAVVGSNYVFWREVLAQGGYLGAPDYGFKNPVPQDKWIGAHFTFLTCKAHRQTAPIVNASDGALRPTYSSNGSLVPAGANSKWRPRLESFSSPSRLAYIADGPAPTGASGVDINGAFWSGSTKPDANAHGGVANILFFDGHIEARRADQIPASATGSAEASSFWTGS